LSVASDGTNAIASNETSVAEPILSAERTEKRKNDTKKNEPEIRDIREIDDKTNISATLQRIDEIKIDVTQRVTGYFYTNRKFESTFLSIKKFFGVITAQK
jgi:hypothetical protein